MKIAIISANNDFSAILKDLLEQSGHDAACLSDSASTSGFEAVVIDNMPDFKPSCRAIWLGHGDGEVMSLPFAFCNLLQWLAVDKNKSVINIADGRIDKAHRLLSGPSGEVALTDKEIELLEMLVTSGADGVERKKTLALVWGYSEMAETTTLETHIYRLRRKFEETGISGIISNQSGVVRLEFSEDK